MGPIGVLARRCSVALGLVFATAFGPNLPAQQHRVVELHAPKQTAPSVLNGVCDGADAYTVVPLCDGTASVWFSLKTYRNWGGTTVDEELQMFINVANTANKVTLWLDLDHNNLTSSGVQRRIEITKNPSNSSPCANCATLFDVTNNNSIPFAPVTCGVSNQPLNNPGSPWTLEFHISACQLQVNTIPALIGMYMEVTGGGATTTIYPAALTGEPTTNQADRNTWAHVRTRNPADFAMMLDNSGSMLQTDGLPENRWMRARRATDVMEAALSLFNDSYYNDQIAVAKYSWDCNNDLSGDRTGPLSSGGSTSWIFITGTPARLTQGSDPPLPNNCTPIQRGLDFAINQEGGALNQDRDRIVVLLSDGLHNMPSADVPLNLDALPFQGKHDKVQVISVAMLPDGTGGTMQMDAITDAFRGPPFKARYNNVIHFADLLQAYLEPLEDLHAVNFVPRENNGTFLPGKASKLVFLAAWNDAAKASTLSLSNDAVATGTVTTYSDQTTGYSVAIASNSTMGAWTATATGPNQPDAVYLIVDMQVYAQFLVEQRRYSAGEPILLSVDLRDRGSPIRGADVTFSMDRPGMGLGDFLSTIQPNCTFAEPKFPPPPRPDSLRVQVSQRLTRAGRAGPVTSTASDPLPGRYQLAADDFKRCGQNLLGRLQDAGIQLHDDGIPPDIEKGDGVYAYAFTPPEEGSYNLTFRVSANTTDGVPFRRSYRLSEFARITPTANATSQIVQNGGLVNGRQVTHVLLLFQDSLRNYVGPGLADLFKVKVEGAHVLDSLSDLGNGYYRLTMDYARGGPEPVVTVRMPGSTYEQVIDLSQRLKPAFALSLHAGISLPHGTLRNGYDRGVGITADLEHRLSRTFTIAALFGFHRFDSVATSVHLDITHISGSVETFLTQGTVALFIDAGGGSYTFHPGSTKPGAHAGAGLELEVSRHLSLGASYRWHTVFTSGSNTTFSSIQAGARIRF
jgi:hypothetical protein